MLLWITRSLLLKKLVSLLLLNHRLNFLLVLLSLVLLQFRFSWQDIDLVPYVN